MVRKIISFFIFIIVTIVSGYAYSSTVELRNGTVVDGIIVKQDDDSIVLDTGIGVNTTYFMEDVLKIDGNSVGAVPLDRLPVVEDVLPPSPVKEVDNGMDMDDLIAQINEDEDAAEDNSTDQVILNNQTASDIDSKEYDDDMVWFISSNKYIHEIIKPKLIDAWKAVKGRVKILSIKPNIPREYFQRIVTGIFILLYVLLFLPFFLLALRMRPESAIFAWIPPFQPVLFVRMADKELTWALFFLVPIVNIFIYIFLWMEICKLIKKPAWLGILMIVPPLAYLLIWYFALAKEKSAQRAGTRF